MVSQRVVRPCSLSDESMRANASSGARVPRRRRAQVPRLSGAIRYGPDVGERVGQELEERLQRTVKRAQREEPRLVVEVGAREAHRREPGLDGLRAFLRPRGRGAAP